MDNLKVFCRWGCKPKVRQMRCTVSLDIPDAAAMERTVHWVWCSGFSLSVLYTTAATCSSSMERGVPGRSSSYRPMRPCSTKRLRHFPTVAGEVDKQLAMAWLGQPSAASRTISARRTRPWGLERELARDCNCFRVRSLNSNGTNGRPDRIVSLLWKRSLEKDTHEADIMLVISETIH